MKTKSHICHNSPLIASPLTVPFVQPIYILPSPSFPLLTPP